MKRLYAITFLLTLGFYSLGFSQTFTWTGEGDNYFWSDPLNWDTETVPLQDGVGTVIIPIGAEVHSTSVINLKAGGFTGGGTFVNDGIINIIHDSETNATKTFSNIYIDSSGPIRLFKSAGISNDEPVYINEGALIKISNQQNYFTVDNMNISFNSTLPGKIEVLMPFEKLGEEDTFIDVELFICCYDFEVIAGTLLIEPATMNQILSPDLFISENAALIFSGNNHFTSNMGIGSTIEGVNEGYLEIKNKDSEHPFADETLGFDMEGTITFKDVTFDGEGDIRFRNCDVLITGDEDFILDGIDFFVGPNATARLGLSQEFTIQLLNGSRLWGSETFFFDGAQIVGTGSGEEIFLNGGELEVLSATIPHQLNGLQVRNFGVIQLNQGSIFLDEDATFYNHYFQDPKFPDYVEYGEVLGSGTFGFPPFSASADVNNGNFSPSPETTLLTTINYNQSETATLHIDINGLEPITDFDKIENTGSVNFEGNIDVTLGYAPTIGDEFIILVSDTPLATCTPTNTVTATYQGFEYIFNVLCGTDTITLRLEDIMLSVSEVEMNSLSQHIVYPIPVNQELSIAIGSSNFDNNLATLEIYTQVGQLIETTTISSEESLTLPVAHLPSGIYYTILRRSNGFQSYAPFIKL